MRRYLLHLSYLGTRYRGFQKQNFGGNPFYEDPHTVCGLLEIALKGCEPANHPIVFPSSRTDKGVHALRNTVHVDLDSDRKKISEESVIVHLNKFFEFNDHDIRVLKIQQVADDFHARFNAYERHYLYRLAVPKHEGPFHHRFHRPCPLTELHRCYFPQNNKFDSEGVRSACSVFVGKKDFAAVSSKSKDSFRSTIREILTFKLEKGVPFIPNKQLLDEYDFWHFTCSARSFLYHQVRRMVSALISYGQGSTTLADLQRLIDEPVEASWNRIKCHMVPAHGLYLLNVLYNPEDLQFIPDMTESELLEKQLREEEERLYCELRNFDGTVLQKINLKQKLILVKKRLTNC